MISSTCIASPEFRAMSNFIPPVLHMSDHSAKQVYVVEINFAKMCSLATQILCTAMFETYHYQTQHTLQSRWSSNVGNLQLKLSTASKSGWLTTAASNVKFLRTASSLIESAFFCGEEQSSSVECLLKLHGQAAYKSARGDDLRL